MGLTDEIRGLSELRDRGTLTEAEFAKAKAALIDDTARGSRRKNTDALGDAAQKWVRFQIVWAIVVFAVMAIVLSALFLSPWSKSKSKTDFDQPWKEFPTHTLPRPIR
jgi:hypothetical protein